jgi:hypothetical protein
MSPEAPYGRICRDCKWFDGSNCHRLPPTWQQMERDGYPLPVFPLVKSTDWCGEWKWDRL